MFGERECHPMSKKANPAALLPILVFLVLYLGLGLIFEYVLKIPMGFYSIPIVVIFLIALLVACCQNRALSFDEKLTLMGHGVGDKNIITMLLIFLAAGMFVGVVGLLTAASPVTAVSSKRSAPTIPTRSLPRLRSTLRRQSSGSPTAHSPLIPFASC